VSHGVTGFGNDFYFSASAFFNVSTSLAPHDTAAKALRIAEAATGYAVLFVVIGYLPALFQAFSRREVAVSMMDARAASPPSASRLLQRSGHLGGWEDLDEYLADWERWAAELMETHLSYPILGYFRSQHVNQNWLAALASVLDLSAALSAATDHGAESAELTFAIGRHAVADLSYTFRLKPSEPDPPRLDDDGVEELHALLQTSPWEIVDRDEFARRLTGLRAMYEPHVNALSQGLALPVPPWRLEDEAAHNWRQTGAAALGRRDLLP
jgi:hypothetical protein